MVHKSSKHFGHDWSVSRILKSGDQIVTGGIDGKVVYWFETESSMSVQRSVVVDVKVDAMCCVVGDGGPRVLVGGNLKKDVAGVEGKMYILGQSSAFI
jgi:hypothetical protein